MTPPTSTDFKGNWPDRLAGLFSGAVSYEGKHVIDVGCHMGIIAYEVSKQAPASIVGLDIVPNNIQIARSIFEHIDLPSDFRVCNLGDWGDVRDTVRGEYDIALILATHHHVKRVHGSQAATRALTNICTRTREAVVFRGPADADVGACLSDHGFDPIYQQDHSKLHPLTIWGK